MSIADAKKELYSLLKGKNGVTGAGIKQKRDGSGEIVIFITKPKKEISVTIPSSYKGNKVSTELRSAAKAM